MLDVCSIVYSVFHKENIGLDWKEVALEALPSKAEFLCLGK